MKSDRHTRYPSLFRSNPNSKLKKQNNLQKGDKVMNSWSKKAMSFFICIIMVLAMMPIVSMPVFAVSPSFVFPPTPTDRSTRYVGDEIRVQTVHNGATNNIRVRYSMLRQGATPNPSNTSEPNDGEWWMNIENQYNGVFSCTPTSSTWAGRWMKIIAENNGFWSSPIYVRIESKPQSRTTYLDWSADSENITSTTARLTGTLSTDGTISFAEYRYGTSSSNLNRSANAHRSGSNWVADITGLSANTTYYYALYAETTDGWSTNISPNTCGWFTTQQTLTPAVITPTSPANNASFVQGASVTISATVTGTDYGWTGFYVRRAGENTNVASAIWSTNASMQTRNPSWTWNTTGVAPGQYEIWYVPTPEDWSEAPDSWKRTRTITINPPTLTPAVITPTSPANNASFEQGASVTISATVTGTDYGWTGFYVKKVGESTDVASAIWSTNASMQTRNPSWTWDTTGVTPGQYEIWYVPTNRDWTHLPEAWKRMRTITIIQSDDIHFTVAPSTVSLGEWVTATATFPTSFVRAELYAVYASGYEELCAPLSNPNGSYAFSLALNSTEIISMRLKLYHTVGGVPVVKDFPVRVSMTEIPLQNINVGVATAISRAQAIYEFTFTPVRDFYGWGKRSQFREGVTYRGLPYGAGGVEILIHCELSEFTATVQNPSSRLYTRSATADMGNGPRHSPFYAIDCSAFVSYIINVPRMNTIGFMNRANRSDGYYYVSFDDVRPGDLLVRATHMMFVYDTSQDFISYFDQAATGIPGEETRRRTRSKTDIQREGYRVIRVSKFDNDSMWNDNPDVPGIVARPSPHDIWVDGVDYSNLMTIYNINEQNFVKVRDLAAILNGSGSQFDVGWNNAQQMVVLTTAQPYTSVSGDLSGRATSNRDAAYNHAIVQINGRIASLVSYNIDDSTYFNVRDMAREIGFSVKFEPATSTIVITSSGFVPLPIDGWVGIDGFWAERPFEQFTQGDMMTLSGVMPIGIDFVNIEMRRISPNDIEQSLNQVARYYDWDTQRYTHHINTTWLKPGEYNLFVSAGTHTGAESVSNLVGVTINSRPPTMRISGISNGRVANGGSVVVSGEYFNGTEEIIAILERNGRLLRSDTVGDGNGNYSHSFSRLTEGNYDLRVEVIYDNGDRRTTNTINFSVDAITLPPTANVTDEVLADLAHLSYRNFTVNSSHSGWRIRNHFTHPQNNFSYTIFERDDSIVVAFRGTPFPDGFNVNTITNWGQTLNYYFSPDVAQPRHAQYSSLVSMLETVFYPILENGNKDVYITGHSLGGWLALQSYRYINDNLSLDNATKVKRVVTFNSVGLAQNHGRRIDYLWRNRNQATVIKNYVVCCDVARWFGHERSFSFPGDTYLINQPHSIIGAEEYVHIHSLAPYSSETLSHAPSRTYQQVIGALILPGDENRLNAFKNLSVRIDSHGRYQGILHHARREVTTIRGLGANIDFSTIDTEVSTFAITSGNLPDGLTLFDNGIVSGTPTETGMFSLTIEAQNDGDIETKEFVLTVRDDVEFDCDHCVNSGDCCEYCNPCICPDSFTITFNLNGGEFINTEYETRTIKLGENIGILPRMPTAAEPNGISREGYRFTGWFESVDGEYVRRRDNFTVTCDVTLIAEWEEIPDIKNFRVGSTFNDGRVTSADATAIARWIIGHSVEGFCHLAADMDGDGEVTLADLTMIARWLVGFDLYDLIAHHVVE